ncbi:MAG TPA: 5-oxoprolinase subunit PxpB [Candidatus Dormibacteraeota bacterium]
MWRIDPAGDQALLVRLGTSIDAAVLCEVLALEQALKDLRLSGLKNMVPAYASLLCQYDSEQIAATQLEERIRSLEGMLAPVELAGDLAEIPTKYDGPDLAEVAEKTGLTARQVIDRHAERSYLVYCVGFAPGFTYCGELDQRLALPRRASPRVKVPAGSVAIAGRQTGIYAVGSPGGWHLIGRTDAVLFDPRANPPARFKPGDRIRFRPI